MPSTAAAPAIVSTIGAAARTAMLAPFVMTAVMVTGTATTLNVPRTRESEPVTRSKNVGPRAYSIARSSLAVSSSALNAGTRSACVNPSAEHAARGAHAERGDARERAKRQHAERHRRAGCHGHDARNRQQRRRVDELHPAVDPPGPLDEGAKRRGQFTPLLERHAELLGKRVGGLWTITGFLREAPVHEMCQLARHGDTERPERGRRLRDVARENLRGRPAFERKASGERVESRRAEPVQVTARVDLAPERLLGAHEFRSAGDAVARFGARGARRFRSRRPARARSPDSSRMLSGFTSRCTSPCPCA